MLITSRLRMHSSHRFATSFGLLNGLVRVSLGVALGFAPSCALDEAPTAPAMEDASATDDGADAATAAVCTTGPIRCHAQIRTFGPERRIAPHAAAPIGFGPPDLQAAYNIN